MGYSGAVLARARARLEERQAAHRREQAERRARICRQVPRIAELERALSGTAARLVSVSLKGGPDRAAAVEALRQENLARQREEADLLRAHGWAPEDMEERPLCPLCGDTGWRGAQMCDCLAALCREEQAKELSSLLDLGGQTFDTFRLDYYSRTIEPGMTRSPWQNMSFILGICRDYAAGTASAKDLFLNGGPGLGKTFLSACIAGEASRRGQSVVYDSAPTVFARFEARKFARDWSQAQAAEEDTQRYLSCDLLILDDLGSEFTSPLVQAALYELVNGRLAAGRRTVISSNLNLDQIRARYGAPIASRLEGAYLSLPFFGEDIRLQKKRGV